MGTPSESDTEKGQAKIASSSPEPSTSPIVEEGEWRPVSWLRSSFPKFLTGAFVETRGIERVPAEERIKPSAANYLQMVLIWFSANLSANNIAVGLLGPSVYQLSYLDSALCATFGSIVGCAATAFTSTWGPKSGNRTMIVARYTMGWWPSRICVLLNMVIMLGYGMIGELAFLRRRLSCDRQTDLAHFPFLLDCVIGGQMLSAVADNNMSIIVGIIIVAIITWVVTVIGLPIFHIYERYAWAPQVAVCFILVGCAGPYFNTSTPSIGDGPTIAGNRLTFFSLCLSSCIAWAPAGADFFVYYPEEMKSWHAFSLTLIGEGLSQIFAYLLGIGIASGIATRPSWSAADEISPGAVMVAAFDTLGRFGKFCGVVVALGVIANNVPGTYSASLGFQCLGSWPLKVPRFFWNTVGVIIYTICGAVGRNHLYSIFEDLLPLMGYWVTIWFTISLEEQFIFRRHIGYDWSAWNDKSKLPHGFAALTAFLVGWAGSIISMDQVWYAGPVAKLVGADGSDLGIYLGVGFAGIVYPPLRYLEKRIVGR
ncbi:hypothetical protein M430DRAFT_60497 [Amorphotheca resinae ATCC 22711]|uniref:Nucleoside transporter n=1 Tax=Amorphotheca resinae ATCC 22711 TaxID=857342 RepID=A0A2T3AU72_AMORE|nr:hypothetical protein M430DRAFT_60497 [Amorphotheca resinae ATCC 22711]PSS12217.1 hypothetical protein M430DRAFT_60497 [Amorphotheca resinae ATCC 22711]